MGHRQWEESRCHFISETSGILYALRSSRRANPTGPRHRSPRGQLSSPENKVRTVGGLSKVLASARPRGLGRAKQKVQETF